MSQCVVHFGGSNNNWPGRQFQICTLFEGCLIEDLICKCQKCDIFFLRCCHHNKRPHGAGAQRTPDQDNTVTEPCHNYIVVYSDGACRNNGSGTAVGGFGVAFGDRPKHQFNDVVGESYGRQTSQRSELVAAIEAVVALCLQLQNSPEYQCRKTNGRFSNNYGGLIVADSEYVVKGMTEWMPNWKKQNWKNAAGKPPQNRDLFKLLDETIIEAEAEGIRIWFQHIPRDLNKIADRLAKQAVGISP